FFVCGPTTSPPPSPYCNTGGTQVGTAVTISSGSATSAAFTPTTAGTYCFRIEYTPGTSGNYIAGSETNQITTPPNNECFAATTPVLTLTKTADAATVSPGTTIGFVITLSNAGPGTAL